MNNFKTTNQKSRTLDFLNKTLILIRKNEDLLIKNKFSLDSFILKRRDINERVKKARNKEEISKDFKVNQNITDEDREKTKDNLLSCLFFLESFIYNEKLKN